MPSSPAPAAPALAKPAQREESCGACHYLGIAPPPGHAPKGSPPVMFCRRYPPQIIAFMAGPPPAGMLVGPNAAQAKIVLVQNKPEFPAITPADWCGEFDPRRGS